MNNVCYKCGSKLTEHSINCTACTKTFCDNCYDTGKGDGCQCHQSSENVELFRDEYAKAVEKLNKNGYEVVGDKTLVPHPSGLTCWLIYVRRRYSPGALVSPSLVSEQKEAHPAMIRKCSDAGGTFWVVQTLIVGDNLPYLWA
jgi:hypothetical protein